MAMPIGVKLVEEPNQYVFLTGVDINNSNLAARNADANVIFTDGKMETVTVNLRNSRGLDNNGRPDGNGTLLNGYNGNVGVGYSQMNTWCTYTVDANGVYTLRRVSEATADAAGKTYKAMQEAQDVAGGDVEINKSHVALNGANGGAPVLTAEFTATTIPSTSTWTMSPICWLLPVPMAMLPLSSTMWTPSTWASVTWM